MNPEGILYRRFSELHPAIPVPASCVLSSSYFIPRKQIGKFTGIESLHFQKRILRWILFSGFIPLNCASFAGQFFSNLFLRNACFYPGLLKRILRMSASNPYRRLIFFS